MTHRAPAAVLAAVLLLLGTAAVRADDRAPDFSVTDLKGKTLTLADYRGKVLVLNFWATWCGPCRAEIPDFIEAYRDNKAKGLEILGLSVDRMTADRLQAFVDKAGINYPVALADAKIAGDYEPGDYIPSTIVVDKNGVIRARRVGMLGKDDLLDLFRKLNAE